MASLYSEADLGKGSMPPSQFPLSKPPPSNAMSIPTPPNSLSPPPMAASPEQSGRAELVALSLLSKFSDRHLPKASEMQWLDSDKGKDPLHQVGWNFK